jgi:uroporphyrinogen decarboxylase
MQPLLIRSFKGQNIERLPVWLMRQAGRYLPEYRQTRAKAGSFLNLCKHYAAEITLQPLKRFDLDAAIIFADILLIPDAMGCGLYFVEGHGPKFKAPVDCNTNLTNYNFKLSDLDYVYEAINKVKSQLSPNQTLIGFAGSPWTVACYMMEGGSSKNFSNILAARYNDTNFLHLLLKTLAKNTIEYLDKQIEAGADCLMLFDSWGGILPKEDFKDFSMDYAQLIIDHFNKKSVPIIFFSKNSGRNIDLQINAGATAIGLDWNIDNLSEISSNYANLVIQGNLDPYLMCTNKEIVKNKTLKMLNAVDRKTRYIANLGHGIMPEGKVECVESFIDTVHSYVT